MNQNYILFNHQVCKIIYYLNRSRFVRCDKEDDKKYGGEAKSLKICMHKAFLLNVYKLNVIVHLL